jgi:hypothetical protein
VEVDGLQLTDLDEPVVVAPGSEVRLVKLVPPVVTVVEHRRKSP